MQLPRPTAHASLMLLCTRHSWRCGVCCGVWHTSLAMMRRMLWCVMHGRCIFVLVVNLVYLVATCAYDGMESMSLNPMIGPCAAPAAAAKHERQPDDRPVCRRMPAAKLKPQKDACGRADDERPQSCVHAHTRLSPPACCVGSRRTAKGLLKMGAKNSDLIFDCKDFWRIITCNWMHVGWVYTHHCTRGMCPSGIGPLIHAQRRNATLLLALADPLHAQHGGDLLLGDAAREALRRGTMCRMHACLLWLLWSASIPRVK